MLALFRVVQLVIALASAELRSVGPITTTAGGATHLNLNALLSP